MLNENEERDIFKNEALENPRSKEAESSRNLGATRIEPSENVPNLGSIS